MVAILRCRKLDNLMNNREHGLAPVRGVRRVQATATSASPRFSTQEQKEQRND